MTTLSYSMIVAALSLAIATFGSNATAATVCTNVFLDAATLQKVATFPSARQPTLDGGALNFGVGPVHNDVLVSLPLDGLVPLTTTNVGTLSVRLEIEPSSQYSPFVVLSAAGDFAGIQMSSDTGGSLLRMEGHHDGMQLTELTAPRDILRSGTGQPNRLSADFLFFPGRSAWLEISGTRGPLTTHFVPALHLTPTGPFSILLFGGWSTTTFTLRSIEISYCSGLAVADSELDFKGRPDGQGTNGWTYGYYDASAHPSRIYDAIADFQLLENYSSTRDEWYIEGGGVANASGGWYTSVRRRDVVPNQVQAPSSPVGTLVDEHWVIRRWTAPESANYLIVGSLAKRAAAVLGDGVEGMVMVAGFPVFKRTLAGEDISGATFSLQLGLSEGTPVDFVVAPNGTLNDDWTDLTIAIGEMVHPSALPAKYVGIRRALEIILPTTTGKRYFLQTTDRISQSPDWVPPANAIPQGDLLIGDGLEHRRFYPMDGPNLFFRSVEE